MIEIKHLKSLQMLRKYGSIVQAAHELHITHSALSHQFHELEHRLGFTLFIRKTQPLLFTEQGEILLALADKILPEIRAALNRCNHNNTDHLRLAVECHSCIQWLLPVLSQFKQFHPRITLDYQSGIVFDPQPALSKGEIDIVLTADKLTHAEINYLPLFDFEIRAVFSPDHPLANKTNILPVDLEQQILLVYPVHPERLDIMTHFLKPQHVSVKLKHVDNTALLIQMVSAQMGIAALPHWVVHKNEQQNLIKTASLSQGLWRTLYAAVSPHHPKQAVLTDFVKLIKQYANEVLPYTKIVP